MPILILENCDSLGNSPLLSDNLLSEMTHFTISSIFHLFISLMEKIFFIGGLKQKSIYHVKLNRASYFAIFEFLFNEMKWEKCFVILNLWQYFIAYIFTIHTYLIGKSPIHQNLAVRNLIVQRVVWIIVDSKIFSLLYTTIRSFLNRRKRFIFYPKKKTKSIKKVHYRTKEK